MPHAQSPPLIHPTAIIEPGAQLAPDVAVGAYAYIGPRVKLGPGCVVFHHACIEGDTTAGSNNQFFPFCTIGGIPQDLKYRGGHCTLDIGDSNTFREYASVHVGTEDGGGATKIGAGNLLMAHAHIAHDCILADRCILANNVMIAGHCQIDDWAVISGGSGLTHFVSVGQHAFVGGVLAILRDVPPFTMFGGAPTAVRGINRVGLKRRKFPPETLDALKTAYRILYCQNMPVTAGIRQLREMFPSNAQVGHMLDFIERSAQGKSGRYLESQRGKTPWTDPNSTDEKGADDDDI